MASQLPTQIAELVQTAHIVRHPSPTHDLNPSTAASRKEPVYAEPASVSISHHSSSTSTSTFHSQSETRSQQSYSHSSSQQQHSIDDIDDDDDDEIPISVLRPVPRRGEDGGGSRGLSGRGRGRGGRPQPHLPPMPDLRFEQSYLHSIAGAQSWGAVAWITVRDQVMMPLAQGVLYNLAIVGWQHWNRNAQLSGSSVGARVRRWWYGVNNWPLPDNVRKA